MQTSGELVLHPNLMTRVMQSVHDMIAAHAAALASNLVMQQQQLEYFEFALRASSGTLAFKTQTAF